MAGIAVRKKSSTPASVLAIGSPFRGYGPENEQAVRKERVKRDPVIEELKELYRKTEPPVNEPTLHDYARISMPLKNHSYSSSDIERFSLALAGAEGIGNYVDTVKAGLFLSALINNGKENDYVVHTAHLNGLIDCLGWSNTKNIVICGDVGILTGSDMKRGTITVEGNAGDFTGDGMQGGEIHIGGASFRLEHLGNIYGGKIFHQGKLIPNPPLELV